MKKLSNLLLYPFLFSVYPFVSLLGSNIREVQLAETWHMFAFSLLFGAVVLLIAKAIVKDWNIAGVITTIVAFSFFSYGHVYDILGNAGPIRAPSYFIASLSHPDGTGHLWDFKRFRQKLFIQRPC